MRINKIKRLSLSALMIVAIALLASNVNSALAQVQPLNIDVVTQSSGKKVIENPTNGTTATATQLAEATCPDGSVLVGFNLDNIGDNYSYFGRLYCRTTTSMNLGPVTQNQGKKVIENPWGGGTASSDQVSQSSCPDGSVLAGFNLNDMGSNYSTFGTLYCRAVPSVTLGAVTQYQNKSIAESSPQSPYAISTCPDGSALVGFNLNNQGDSYSTSGTLYCRKISSSFNYGISASDIGSVQQGGTGVSAVSATLAANGTISSIFSGSCVTVYDNENYPPRFDHIACTSNHPTYSYFDYQDNNLTQARTSYANIVCGNENWTLSGSVFTCLNSISRSIPSVARAVSFVVSQVLNASNVDVLGRTDGTGVQFVSFVPTGVTPTGNSSLSLRAGQSAPNGVYTFTVVSNTSDNAPAFTRTDTGTLTVTAGAPVPTNFTATPGVCGTNPTEVAMSWSAPPASPGYSLTGYKIYRDGSSIYTTPGSSATNYTDTTASVGQHTYGVSAVYLHETSPGVFVGEESASTTASVTSPSCLTCGGSIPQGGNMCSGDDQGLTTAQNWHQVSSCTAGGGANKCEYTTSAATQYTITATAGAGGIINPNGTFTVASGANQSFAITLNSGYRVASLYDNGIFVGTPLTYSLTGISQDHVIEASFESNTTVGSINMWIENPFNPFDKSLSTIRIKKGRTATVKWEGIGGASSNSCTGKINSSAVGTNMNSPYTTSNALVPGTYYFTLSCPQPPPDVPISANAPNGGSSLKIDVYDPDLEER